MKITYKIGKTRRHYEVQDQDDLRALFEQVRTLLTNDAEQLGVALTAPNLLIQDIATAVARDYFTKEVVDLGIIPTLGAPLPADSKDEP